MTRCLEGMIVLSWADLLEIYYNLMLQVGRHSKLYIYSTEKVLKASITEAPGVKQFLARMHRNVPILFPFWLGDLKHPAVLVKSCPMGVEFVLSVAGRWSTDYAKSMLNQ